MATKILKGITWDHSRAFPPLVAVSQRYEELHPGVRIHWDKRTLDEFGHKPIDQLANEYDLIVIDHPWAGFCFEKNIVLDLKQLLTQEQENDLAQNCVGSSFDSYLFEGKLLALPIDVATPVPSWRPDLMAMSDVELPVTWDDLLSLADKKLAIMPAFRADLLLNWLMLLHALNARPFESADVIAEKDKAIEAMEMLKRLAEPMPDTILDWNPIIIAELLTRRDVFAYCAFAYSYSNYSRDSFTNKPLCYGNLVKLKGKRLRSILGGTGLAISSFCKEINLAIDFSFYCASAEVQSNLYIYAGGQPARKEAWVSEKHLDFSGRFFADSFASHKEAIVRPRYNGYVPLQEKAGMVLQQFIKHGLPAEKAWEKIGEEYRNSLSSEK